MFRCNNNLIIISRKYDYGTKNEVKSNNSISFLNVNYNRSNNVALDVINGCRCRETEKIFMQSFLFCIIFFLYVNRWKVTEIVSNMMLHFVVLFLFEIFSNTFFCFKILYQQIFLSDLNFHSYFQTQCCSIFWWLFWSVVPWPRYLY